MGVTDGPPAPFPRSHPPHALSLTTTTLVLLVVSHVRDDPRRIFSLSPAFFSAFASVGHGRSSSRHIVTAVQR